jgi:hypothetical protein
MMSVENNPQKPIVLKESDFNPASAGKTPKIAGPIADFQNTPFLVVVGTSSKDSLMNKVIQQQLATMVGDWKGAQQFEPRVKKDVEVSEAEMTTYSMFLLGGPSENTVSKQVFAKIPFSITNDAITIDGTTFKVKDAILRAVYPNPFNTERYVAIVAATSGAGQCYFDLHRGSLFQYDYLITDGKIPVFSVGAKDEKILIASGFFSNDWKMDKLHLYKGDDTLRAKCAYSVVNSDLSTSIVSFVQPSPELLKSYVGMYQIQNGPTVKVFLDNDVLRAAQVPNDQFSLKLVPTSDSEFYAKEVNLSIGFEKDTSTSEYAMVVYQSGQKYVSKILK